MKSTITQLHRALPLLLFVAVSLVVYTSLEAEFVSDRFGGITTIQSQATGSFRVGQVNNRWMLITPEGQGFLALGLSHAGGAWQGLLGPKRQEALEKVRNDLRDLNFNATGYVPELSAEFNYIHNADRLPGSPGTLSGQGKRKHLYEDVFDPAFHARLQKHIQGIADKTAQDGHCIGYWWTDIPVWNPGQQRQKFGLSYVDFIRALPEGAPGRIRYESWKKENTTAKDETFHILIARELYRATAAAYREFAPGKLLFSERYNTIPGAPLEIIAEAGKVVDVISFQPYEKTLKSDTLDQVYAMTGKPIILSDWSLSFPVEGHTKTMWPQFSTPAEAATAYEAYLNSAFAKPYILGYFKCQYRDAILPTGQLKQGIRTVSGALRKDWATNLKEIHKRLLAGFEKHLRL
jgi:hypothetical protein